MKKFGKIVLIVLIIVVILVFLTFIIGNIFKLSIYSEYYECKKNICKNPGLNDGFVCQGIFAYEEQEKIVVSGYMTKGRASRIYVTDLNDNSYYVSINKNGEKFTGHLGGICYLGDTVYAASERMIYSFPLALLLNAQNGDIIDVGNGIKVNNRASFIYSDDTYIYVGEFNDDGKYITDNIFETSDGKYKAIISVYKANDFEKPIKIYSIRNRVQGVCFTPDGKIVLSTSYGMTSSIYYIYNQEDVTDSGITLDGAPVYFLDNCADTIKGPAMAEGLDYYNGRVITLTESASNKYIFGKLFFAKYIVGLLI